MKKHWTESDRKYLKDNSMKVDLYQLSKNLDRTYEGVRRQIYYMNLPRILSLPRRTINKDFFKTWSEEMAYILGYWFADGCIGSWSNGYHFCITSKDESIINKIKEILESYHKIKYRKSDDTYTLTFSCKEIYNDIVKLGGCERKSLIARFPMIPKKYIRHFIRGYFDGDGSIYLRNYEPHVNFVGTKAFLKSLMENLPYKGNLNNTTELTYQLSYSSEYGREILDYMYVDSNIYLKRKYDKYKESLKWKRERKLRNDSKLNMLNGLPRSYLI